MIINNFKLAFVILLLLSVSGKTLTAIKSYTEKLSLIIKLIYKVEMQDQLIRYFRVACAKLKIYMA